MAPQVKTVVSETRIKNPPEQTPDDSLLSTSPSKIFLVSKLATHNQCGVTISKWKDRKLTDDVETLIHNEHVPVGELYWKAEHLKACLKKEYPDCKIWLVGSFAAGIALSSSDLDFSLEIPNMMGHESAKLEAIWNKLRDYYDHPYYDRVLFTKFPVLKMTLKYSDKRISDVDVDLTLDNHPPKRNTQLLVWYGQIDPRFNTLCRAVKIWASRTGVKNSRNGFLNSFSVCILVIFFLQQVKVLPNIQEVFEELNGELEIQDDDYYKRDLLEELHDKGIVVGQNGSSLGALFFGFMKFYSELDFEAHWISIKRGKLLKKIDEDGNPVDGLPHNSLYIVLEDPFLEHPFNCARTVKDLARFKKIQNEFQRGYDDIKNYHRIICDQSPARVTIEKDGIEVDERIKDVDQFPVVNMNPYENWDKVIPGLKDPKRNFRIHPKMYYDLNFGNFGL
ncbi:hypothetical protein CAEBREN_17557 [Caenorhabditis brenneri]|uniref:Uncharacterized protein n=1 Tax=Caenorhabditis brenneri TaxID=135651 RepID=G0N4D5_CAEBE|nr:hypothetical protein CAEBREN_17557 [Caenorhabditis brenneri]